MIHSFINQLDVVSATLMHVCLDELPRWRISFNFLDYEDENCKFLETSVTLQEPTITSTPKQLNLINNCRTGCNTKQFIYYTASSLYMFLVSTTPVITSTQNCNYSLRYCAVTSLQRAQASLATLEGGSCTKNMTSTVCCSYRFVYS